MLDAGTGKSSSSAGEQAGANKFLTGGATGTGNAGKVYMGTELTPKYANGEFFKGYNNTPSYLTKKEAYDQFNLFSGKQLRDFINAGQVGGLLQDDAGFIEAQGVWKRLVDASAGLTGAGRDLTPMDVLSGYLGKGELANLARAKQNVWQVQYRGGRKFLVNTQTGEVKYQGPQFETTYNKSIDLTDPTTAKAIATSVFQQLLHRDPGSGEMGGFADALRNAEQQSPVVTNTTTEYDMNTGEAIGQSSTSTGGLGADAKKYVAEQRAKSSKEYGATQAATYYGPALEAAIFNNPFGRL